jgi:hypothetical protein
LPKDGSCKGLSKDTDIWGYKLILIDYYKNF